MAAAMVIWNYLCLLLLTLQVLLHRRYQASKLPTNISLTDLINADLVHCFYLTIFSLSFMTVPQELEISLPPLVTHALTMAVTLMLYCVFLYLIASAIVQYVLVVCKKTSLIERITDVESQRCLRVLIGSVGLVLQGFRLASIKKINLYLNLPDQDVTKRSDVGMKTIFALGVSAILINLVLRVLMTLERRKSDSKLRLASKRSLASSLLRNLMLVWVVLVPISAYMLVSSFMTKTMAYVWTRRMSFTYFSVLVPLLFTMAEDNLRSFVCKQMVALFNCTRYFLTKRKNSVRPI